MLLGVGFATFVLTFAVVSLAAISVALGEPVLGLAVGAAFGAGRALPVVVLAPDIRTPWGTRGLELMAERPLILRGFRTADGLALAAAAVALATGPAWGAHQVAAPASDPSVSDNVVAYENGAGGGVLRSRGRTLKLPGSDPAVGADFVTWRRGDVVTVLNTRTNRSISRTVGGVEALAVSRTGSRGAVGALAVSASAWLACRPADRHAASCGFAGWDSSAGRNWTATGLPTLSRGAAAVAS